MTWQYYVPFPTKKERDIHISRGGASSSFIFSLLPHYSSVRSVICPLSWLLTYVLSSQPNHDLCSMVRIRRGGSFWLCVEMHLVSLPGVWRKHAINTCDGTTTYMHFDIHYAVENNCHSKFRFFYLLISYYNAGIFALSRYCSRETTSIITFVRLHVRPPL